MSCANARTADPTAVAAQLRSELEALAHDLRWNGDPEFAERAHAIAQKYGATK